MAKYLDYDGLKTVLENEHSYIGNITGNGYAVAGEKRNIKEYIDSRIYVGTAAEVELALEQKLIDETTFVMVEDPDATEIGKISDSEINALFS